MNDRYNKLDLLRKAIDAFDVEPSQEAWSLVVEHANAADPSLERLMPQDMPAHAADARGIMRGVREITRFLDMLVVAKLGGLP